MSFYCESCEERGEDAERRAEHYRDQWIATERAFGLSNAKVYELRELITEAIQYLRPGDQNDEAYKDFSRRFVKEASGR